MSKRTKTLILIAEVIFFTAAAVGVWYYRSLDNFSLERDEQGEIRDSERFLSGPASSDTLARGRALARSHCAGCHLLPEPGILPAAGWRPVLENMGVRMGLGHRLKYLREKHVGLVEGLKRFQQYPPAPTITPEEFRIIKKYYYANAADEDEFREPRTFPATELFAPARSLALARADLTLVKIHPPTNTIYAGGMLHNRPGNPDGFLGVFDADFQEMQHAAFPAPPVALRFTEDYPEGLLTTLGDPAGARRNPAGVYRLKPDLSVARTIVEKPFRLTETEPVDLSGRGKPDLILTGFGALTGGLFLLKSGAKGDEVVLQTEPGPVAIRALDADGDGREDFAVLSAQAREALVVYHNAGEGNDEPATPRRETVAEYQPAFGATGLNVADFNGDGRPDLLVINGDNADFPDARTKAYHGLRIYSNASEPGRIAFREEFFFPMYGATRAAVADFDGDGDADIAVVGLYAIHPGERFLYLRNDGGLNFEPRHLPLPEGEDAPVCGVLDAGDLDGDGDVDLVLGALPYFSDPAGPGQAAAGPARPVLFLLENLRHTKPKPTESPSGD